MQMCKVMGQKETLQSNVSSGHNSSQNKAFSLGTLQQAWTLEMGSIMFTIAGLSDLGFLVQ